MTTSHNLFTAILLENNRLVLTETNIIINNISSGRRKEEQDSSHVSVLVSKLQIKLNLSNKPIITKRQK